MTHDGRRQVDGFEALFAEICAAPKVSLGARDTLEGRSIGAGRFMLRVRIGRGSFGEVWRAWDGLLEQPVAIKLLQQSLAFDDMVVRRFQREMVAASRLHHPGIVRIVATGQEEGVGPFFAMELVRGVPCNRVPARLLAILEVVEEILAALAAAHARGVVHRDLKPDNILIQQVQGRWRCKILDFGVAQLAELTSSLTGHGIVGTPAYACPEQVTGQGTAVGVRSDLYAVGVLLYEMLTGRPPFIRERPTALRRPQGKGTASPGRHVPGSTRFRRRSRRWCSTCSPSATTTDRSRPSLCGSGSTRSSPAAPVARPAR